MSGQVDEPAERAGEQTEPDGERGSAAELDEPTGEAGERAADPDKAAERIGASTERATPGMRLLGFGLIAGAVAAVVRVAADGAGGDWRSGVFVSGLGASLLLGGLAMNGWLTRLVSRLLWIFPATLLFMGIVLVLDPGYGTFLNGDTKRGRIDSDAESIGFAVICLIAGIAGLVGYGFAARNRLFRG